MLSRAGFTRARSQNFDDDEDMPFPELQQEQPVRTTLAERRAASDKLIAAWPPIETRAAAAAGADGGERLEAEHQHHQRGDPTSAGADEGAQLGAEGCSQASGDVTPELLSDFSCFDSPESEANQAWNWIVIDSERCDEPSSPTLPLPGPGKCVRFADTESSGAPAISKALLNLGPNSRGATKITECHEGRSQSRNSKYGSPPPERKFLESKAKREERVAKISARCTKTNLTQYADKLSRGSFSLVPFVKDPKGNLVSITSIGHIHHPLNMWPASRRRRLHMIFHVWCEVPLVSSPAGWVAR